MNNYNDPKNICINTDAFNFATRLIDEPLRKFLYDKKQSIESDLSNKGINQFYIEISHYKEHNDFLLSKLDVNENLMAQTIKVLSANGISC